MTDNYYRLVTILVNICPRPLRELFLKHAAADPNLQTPYTSLDAYLAFRKKDIIKLTQKPKCLLRKDQFCLLFPPAGQSQTDIGTWDVTLLSVLLKNIFTITPNDLNCIETIRTIRNDLQHIAGTCKITEQDFKNTCRQLNLNTVKLALSVQGQCYADKIEKDIKDVECSVLTNLGDVLRDWYMSKISNLETQLEDLKEQIDEIKTDTGKTTKTLKKTTVKRTRSGGKLTKRFKTVDNILENMTKNFESLLKKKLDNDFQSPPETTRIIKEIEDNHLVVVSGFGKGLYLQAALSAIASREYNNGECVLVSSPSDWRHISNEETELVMFLHPFGEITYDEEKAKSFNLILDSIVESTTTKDSEDALDIVIITDQSILEEWKHHFSHEMMENPIVVYKPTTEDSPVNLTEGESMMPQFEADPHYKNLLVQSIAYYKHHRAQMEDGSFKENALESFRSKKVIVISGPRGSGKTTLALSLLSSYQDGHYLILTEPDDLCCIRFGVTCVVVIEDLGGKYMFEMSVIQKWLRKFDMLYSAVKDGKLNVIITSLNDRLSSCIAETKHPMLDNVIELPEHCSVRIKKESPTGCSSISYVTKSIKQQKAGLFSRVKNIQRQKINIEEAGMSNPVIESFCQHPDGSFLVLISYRNITENNLLIGGKQLVLFHFSSDFERKCYYDIDMQDTYCSYYSNSICCTDTGDVVIAIDKEIRLYSISGGNFQLRKSTDLMEYCDDIFFNNKRICCLYNSTMIVLDKNLNIKKEIELSHDSSDMFSPCSLQTFFSVSCTDNGISTIFYDDTKINQVKGLKKNRFFAYKICAATEDSIFILGRERNNEFKILQVNSDMTVLSEIGIPEDYDMDSDDLSFESKMLFDRDTARLVIRYFENIFITIELE